jgi:hypothetical protein
MKRTRLILVLIIVVVGIVVGVTVGVPLHADPPQTKEPLVVPEATPPLEKMIAEIKAIGELVKQLDDAKFEVRQQASERLIRMGKLAVEPLKRVLLEVKPNLETASRINNILTAIRRQDKRTVLAKTAEVRAKLAKSIDLDQGIGPNVTLYDALEMLSSRHELTIIVESNAFAAIGVQKAEETAVCLPKMTGVPLGTVLRLLVGQIKGDQYSGSYVIREGHVEVTTTYHSTIAFMLNEGWAWTPTRVHVEFDGVPLDEALRELADLTGVSVVVDRQVGRKAQGDVTATLNDVPIDAAVRLLADMAGLRLVVMDNVLYVTSKDNAKELEAEQEKRKQQRMKEGQPGPGGPPMAADAGPRRGRCGR